MSAMTALFSEGPTPLENTRSYAGDPGLLGPDSVSWRVLGDASVFVGGVRALLVQAAHPEVVAGVEDHSTYREDPLGRLSRTSVYVTETTYGAMPEVEAAVDVVRKAHRPVKGTSQRQRPYSAGHPELAAWVHNVLTDSFLSAYQAYGPEPLSAADADRFVLEQTRIGALLGASPLPETAPDLANWIVGHGDLSPTDDQRQAIGFLKDPPLNMPVKAGYKLVHHAAVATIDPSMARQLGLEATRGGQPIGRAAIQALRWALGASPSWHLALVRCGAPVPPRLFRQPLPEPPDGTSTTDSSFADGKDMPTGAG